MPLEKCPWCELVYAKSSMKRHQQSAACVRWQRFKAVLHQGWEVIEPVAFRTLAGYENPLPGEMAVLPDPRSRGKRRSTMVYLAAPGVAKIAVRLMRALKEIQETYYQAERELTAWHRTQFGEMVQRRTAAEKRLRDDATTMMATYNQPETQARIALWTLQEKKDA